MWQLELGEEEVQKRLGGERARRRRASTRGLDWCALDMEAGGREGREVMSRFYSGCKAKRVCLKLYLTRTTPQNAA